MIRDLVCNWKLPQSILSQYLLFRNTNRVMISRSLSNNYELITIPHQVSFRGNIYYLKMQSYYSEKYDAELSETLLIK